MAPRPEPRARAKQPVDTVELSKPAPAVPEPEADPVGLLPQLVVRMTDRLRAAFYDRLEGQPKVASEGAAVSDAAEVTTALHEQTVRVDADRRSALSAPVDSPSAQAPASRPARGASDAQG